MERRFLVYYILRDHRVVEGGARGERKFEGFSRSPCSTPPPELLLENFCHIRHVAK